MVDIVHCTAVLGVQATIPAQTMRRVLAEMLRPPPGPPPPHEISLETIGALPVCRPLRQVFYAALNKGRGDIVNALLHTGIARQIETDSGAYRIAFCHALCRGRTAPLYAAVTHVGVPDNLVLNTEQLDAIGRLGPTITPVVLLRMIQWNVPVDVAQWCDISSIAPDTQAGTLLRLLRNDALSPSPEPTLAFLAQLLAAEAPWTRVALEIERIDRRIRTAMCVELVRLVRINIANEDTRHVYLSGLLDAGAADDPEAAEEALGDDAVFYDIGGFVVV